MPQRREAFGPEALAAAMQQAVQWTPLPQLLMRTVIQSLAAASKLRQFVLNEILFTLVNKQARCMYAHTHTE